MKTPVLIGGTLVLAVAGIAALVMFAEPAPPAETGTSVSVDTRTNREVALACTTDMATQFHIHPNLSIMIDGKPFTIPANVGITNGCMNALHTHDATGKLHVESPVQRDFTLADFFAVWGKTFTKDQILDSKVDTTHSIRMLVNGKESQDFENLVLKDLDQIVIEYKKK